MCPYLYSYRSELQGAATLALRRTGARHALPSFA